MSFNENVKNHESDPSFVPKNQDHLEVIFNTSFQRALKITLNDLKGQIDYSETSAFTTLMHEASFFYLFELSQ